MTDEENISDPIWKAFEFISKAYTQALDESGSSESRLLVVEQLVDVAVCAAEAIRSLEDAGVQELNETAKRRVRWPVVKYGCSGAASEFKDRLDKLKLGSALPIEIDQKNKRLNEVLLSFVEVVYSLESRRFPAVSSSWEELYLNQSIINYIALDKGTGCMGQYLSNESPAIYHSYHDLPTLSEKTLSDWLDKLVNWFGTLPLRGGAVVPRKGMDSSAAEAEGLREVDVSFDELKNVDLDNPELPGVDFTNATTWDVESVQGRAMSGEGKAIKRVNDKADKNLDGLKEADDLAGIRETTREFRRKTTLESFTLVKQENSAFRDIARACYKRWLGKKGSPTGRKSSKKKNS